MACFGQRGGVQYIPHVLHALINSATFPLGPCPKMAQDEQAKVGLKYKLKFTTNKENRIKWCVCVCER